MSSRRKYLREAIVNSIAESGLTLPSYAIDALVTDIEIARENEELYFGNVENPLISEMYNLKNAHKNEIAKIECHNRNRESAIRDAYEYRIRNLERKILELEIGRKIF